MPLEENDLPDTATGGDGSGSLPHECSPGAARSGLRTWTLTIAISTAVLVTMYGLAYWNEARGDAGRAISAASSNASAPEPVKAATTTAR
jgi:hypothetical protein